MFENVNIICQGYISFLEMTTHQPSNFAQYVDIVYVQINILLDNKCLCEY